MGLWVGVSPAAAQLPGSGYTFDTYWNCGPIYLTQYCYEPGTLGTPHYHTFGWGSADYDGAGAIYLCIRIGANVWVACGYNLARVCVNANCNDSTYNNPAAVTNEETDGSRHTVKGHAKA